MATRNSIVNGPSKFELMNALLDGNFKNRRKIVFTLESRLDSRDQFPTEPITINVVAREDGSGENWLFEGWMEKNHFHGKDDHWRSRPVNGFYSTKTRKGWIEYDKPSTVTKA